MRRGNSRQSGAASTGAAGQDFGDQPGVDNTDLYKNFGRHDDVGKMLYGMYGANR